jgi:hypothetical protein
MNPFSAFCRISNIRLEDVPVVDDNMHYYETDSDFWLCYDVASLKSCVVRTSGSRVSVWRWNPGYAVQDLQHAMELEADGLLAA